MNYILGGFFMKRINGILLAGAMVLAGAGSIALFLPKDIKAAHAEDVGNDTFYIGTHNMETDTVFDSEDDPSVQGKAEYTAGTDNKPNHLKLTNFHYTGEGACYFNSSYYRYGIWYSKGRNLQIELVGNNSVTLTTSTTEGDRYSGAVFYPKNSGNKYTAEFLGEGSLQIKSPDASNKDSDGIHFRMKVINSAATIEGISGYNLSSNIGIYFYGGAQLTGGSIIGRGVKEGIALSPDSSAGGDFKVEGGTILASGGNGTALGNSNYGFRIVSNEKSSFEMTGGTLTAESNPATNVSYGIYYYNNQKKLSHFKGGTVNASGKYGLYTNSTTDYEYDYLNLSDDVVFNATGTVKAINGRVLNSIEGKGYSGESQTGDEEFIPISSEIVDYTSKTYKSVHFEALEESSFTQEPAAKTGLIANGQPQELVSAGIAEGGTVVYRIGDSGDFSVELPKATNAGTYTVQYMIDGDEDHRDSAIKSVTVTISEAPTPGPDDPVGPVNPDDPSKPTKKGLNGGAVAGIVIGSIVLLLCAAYLLLFFLFNRWVKIGEKAVRVFPFAFGKKDGKERLLAFPCKFVYKEKPEVFKSKEEALKH